MKSVEEMWQEYATTTGVPVGGVQWRETRFAFFAGVIDLFRVLRDEIPRMTDADGVKHLEALWREATNGYRAQIDRAQAEWDKRGGNRG